MNDEVVKKLAMKSNADAWNYLQKDSLGEDEKVQMLCCAYSSLYLWAACGGTSLHFARAHWLISRVCCVLAEVRLAAKHAEMCSTYTELALDRKDFDDVYATEAKARSFALAGDKIQATHFKKRATELAQKINDLEDRGIAEGDIQTEPWFGVN